MKKSIVIPRFGGPEVFRFEEQASDPLRPDGVRIAVKAAGVNFADIMMRMGLYPEAPKPPFVPGYEVAGTVLETGSQATRFKKGDRVVAGAQFGGYTTEIVLPEKWVRPLPAHLSFDDGASIPVNFLTAWMALMEMGRVRAGDRVLIHSAAGGVGLAAVQIAASAGATVVGLTSTQKKAAPVLELGAKEVWTHDFWHHARASEIEGFDLILDPIGGEELKRSYQRLAPCGRVVTYGVSSIVGGQKRSIVRAVNTLIRSPLFPPVKLMMDNRGVFGLNMLKLFEAPIAQSSMDAIMKRFEQKSFRPTIGKSFPLEEAGAAQTHLASRQNIGKVVLTHR